VRVGLHVGDVNDVGGDILGDAVNVASRIEPLAEPGGICVSEPAYLHLRDQRALRWECLGPKSLKGLASPLVVYRFVLPWSMEASPTTGTQPPRLAVLPLSNISPDPQDEYFAQGLTEELISVLSQIRGLRVISRTSVTSYKASPKTVGQVGRELGASSVLEGSVRKAGPRLRITMQLIDVATDEHRWSQSFDRNLDDVFAIQADVAQQTAHALRVELVESERQALLERPTASMDAYQAYLQGVDRARRNLDRGPVADDEIIGYFEKAIRLDPEFAAPYSHLGNYLIAVMGQSRTSKETIPKARTLIGRALELSPSSSDAHTAMGNLAMQGDLDWSLAEAELTKAIQLNPSSSYAHSWFGFLLCTLQRWGDAKGRLRAALEVDPLWLQPQLTLADVEWFSGSPTGAIGMLENLSRSYPESTSVWARLVFLYLGQRRFEEMDRASYHVLTVDASRGRHIRAIVQAWLGDPEPLRAWLQAWEAGSVKEYVSLPIAAEHYGLLGQVDHAFELLEREETEGDRTLWFHYLSPGFDPVRNDPRFIAILRRANLPLTLDRPLQSFPLTARDPRT